MLTVNNTLSSYTLAAGEPFVLEVQLLDSAGRGIDINDEGMSLTFYTGATRAIVTDYSGSPAQYKGGRFSDDTGEYFRWAFDGRFSEGMHAISGVRVELARRLRNGRVIIGTGVLVVGSSAISVPSIDGEQIADTAIRVTIKAAAVLGSPPTLTVGAVPFSGAITLPPSPAFSNAPSVTSDGTPQVGEQLTGVDAAATNLGANTINRAWLLGSTVLANTAAYTTTQTGTHTFRNRIVDVNGAVLATASVDVVVAAATVTPTPAPAFTTQPSITAADSTPQVGELLTGNSGTITNGTVSARQWLLGTTAISGATGATYTPTETGSYTYRVTATGAGGTTTATSAAVSVAVATPTPTPTPTPPASVTPIAPAAATSAAFEEIVTFDMARCFQNADGTNPVTLPGQRVASVKNAAGAIMLTNGTVEQQPTWQIDSQSGNGALLFDGVDDVLFRPLKNQVRSLFIAYALDFANKRARPSYQTPISLADSYKMIAVTDAAKFNAVDKLIFGYTDNRGIPGTATTQVVGHTEVMAMVSDAATAKLYRSGREVASTPQTGTMPATDQGKNATLGANANADGTVSEYTRGLILGYACSSQTLAAAEIPGVSQWFVNLAAQKVTLSKWIGVGFQGDANGDERGASSTVVVQHHSSDLVSQTEYRPSSIRVDFPTTYRDFGLAADAGKLYMTMDATDQPNGIARIFEFDGFSFNKINEVNMANSRTSGAIGVKFARNFDDSIYRDEQGRVYWTYDGGHRTNGGNGLCYIRSQGADWKTGAWEAGQPMPSFGDGGTGVNQIDPFIKRDAAGVWHLLWSDYAAGTGVIPASGQIRHASSTTSPIGPWTIDAAADFYGLGAGVEAPQIVQMEDGSQVLRYDRDGCGYSVATLPNGMGAAAGPRKSVQGDDIIEHGEVCRIPAGFAAPAFQATTARRPFKWAGKGLLVGGDVGADTGNADNGWRRDSFSGTGATDPAITTHYGVADPNGDPTASTISFALGGQAGAYSYLQCNTVETISRNFAGQHTFGVWVRGRAGGEKVTIGFTDAGFTNFDTPNVTPPPLTTAWTYVEIPVVPNFQEKVCMLLGATGPQGTIAVDMCWPTFK